MAHFSNSEVIKRYHALWTQRKTAEQTWQWIERFIMPYRGKFFKTQKSEHEVEWQGYRHVYDSTAIHSCKRLASSLHAAITSSGYQWFHFRFRDDQLNENNEAMEWLEDSAKRVYQALQDSNFDIQAAEMYLDMCGYGTSVMTEEAIGPDDEWLGLDFQTLPLQDCYFEVNHKQQVLHLYRHLRWTPLQIIDKFGEENCPDHVIQKAKSTAGIDQRMDLVFCVFTREVGDDKEKPDPTKPMSPEKRPFGYKYVMVEGSHQLGKEGGYYEMPAFVARWATTAGSQWGHSPSHIVLPDVRSLNKLMELYMRALEKGVDPPILTTDRNILGDLNLEAAKITIVRDPDKVIERPPQTRMDMTQFGIGDMRERVMQMYHVDQLNLKTSPAMTATEVNARLDDMNRFMAPVMGRIQNDFLDPLVSRSFNIMFRKGALAPAPQIVLDSGEWNIEYQGPMARSQKMDQVQAIDGWIQGILAMAEIKPELMDLPDWDAYARGTAEMRQVPASMIKGEAEVEDDREERAKKEAEMQKAVQAQQEGEAMKSMGEGMGAMSEGAAQMPEGAAEQIMEGLGQGGPEAVPDEAVI